MGGGAALCAGLWAGQAAATSALDSPDVGVVQLGRGGAWLARADDPLAAYFNPAALVTQPSGVHLGAHLLVRSHCFERLDGGGQPVSPGRGLAAAPGEVCADIPPFPNPQLGASLRLHRRFALGLAAVAPHSVGSISWPATLRYADKFGETEHPAPQRYLVLESDALALFPTLSGSFAATRQLSFGAGFVWGVLSLEYANMNEAQSLVGRASQPDDFVTDLRSVISGTDGFVPGFVVSALWSPGRRFDLSGWFRWSDALRTNIDLRTEANYYKEGGAVDEKAIGDPANITDEKDAGTFEMPIPMEARLGLRYRHPRRGQQRSQSFVAKHGGWAKDSMSTDLFDLELDLTWAHNSALDAVEIRFPASRAANGPSTIRVNGTPGFIPANCDVPHHWRDALGARLGGDFYAIPDLLSVRAGGFFESKSADDEYLTLDFHAAERIGVAAGATLRLGAFDVSLAYQHTFFGVLDNGGRGKVLAISGGRDVQTGAVEDYRSVQAVNGGSSSSSLDEVALGGSYHF
ncbi:MAG: hypothetical protein HY744_16470 [Deltaproteobacteria bacterium]|nr:hypothetical protein [Deltaproteobacteria bacterium]